MKRSPLSGSTPTLMEQFLTLPGMAEILGKVSVTVLLKLPNGIAGVSAIFLHCLLINERQARRFGLKVSFADDRDFTDHVGDVSPRTQVPFLPATDSPPVHFASSCPFSNPIVCRRADEELKSSARLGCSFLRNRVLLRAKLQRLIWEETALIVFGRLELRHAL